MLRRHDFSVLEVESSGLSPFSGGELLAEVISLWLAHPVAKFSLLMLIAMCGPKEIK